MKIICITVNDDNYIRMGGLYSNYEAKAVSMAEIRQHHRDRGVDAQFFYGIPGPKLGIETTLTYEVDNPGSGFRMDSKTVGCWLSHRALWAACLLLPDELFFIIEDDARFPEDWLERVDRAVLDAADFDVLYIGSCCTENKPTQHIAGNVYEVQWPFCTHGYIVRRSALHTLIETQDEARCYAPIDVSMTLHSLPKLKTRVVKPRILDQGGTNIPE